MLSSASGWVSSKTHVEGFSWLPDLDGSFSGKEGAYKRALPQDANTGRRSCKGRVIDRNWG